MKVITIYATKNYLFAFKNCIRRVITAARHHKDITIIYSSDTSDECAAAYEFIKQEIPSSWQHHSIKLEMPDDTTEKYKFDAQVRIAKLQGMAFTKARQLNAEWCWSIECDVLVPPDALRMMEWTLAMPTALGLPYYDVAMCTYPNGLFLGGRGTPQHPICPDWHPTERKLSDDLRKRFDEIELEGTELQKNKKQPTKEFLDRIHKVHEEIQKCPQDGNIWEVTAKHGWKKRGWLDHAYPTIGRGAILPTDWVGLGCTLLSAKALSLSTFEGYTGQGTQDLFLCWQKWYPEGLKFCVITHTVCDHVKPEFIEGKATGKIKHFACRHESSGEAIGHLRVELKDWLTLDDS